MSPRVGCRTLWLPATINLQPYSVFTYEGVLDLTPTIDTWVETREQPDLVIRDNTAYNAIRDMSDGNAKGERRYRLGWLEEEQKDQ